MINFNKTDKIILSVSSLIILIYSYLLYDDSFLFNQESSSYQQVGILAQSKNDVRRKAIESFLWAPAKKEQSLHEKDSIFTGVGSTAELMLQDGSIIKLEENSLVTLSLKEGQLELNLKYGEVQTDLKEVSKLQIKSDQDNITIQNNQKGRSKASIKKSSVGPAKIDLLDGSLSLLSNKKNQKFSLQKNESLYLNSSGSLQKVAPGKITLLTPDQTKVTLIDTKQGFFVNWSSENTSDEVVLIAKDINFSQVVAKKDKVSSKVLFQDIPQGNYFWKVEGRDHSKKAISSKTHAIEVIVFNTPTITTPENNALLSFNTNTNLATWVTPHKVEWQSDYSTFEYQLSLDPSFQKILDVRKITTPSITSNLKPGTYYSRVRGLYNNSQSDWSPVVKFTISVTKTQDTPPPIAELKAPTLLTKKIKLDLQNSRAPAAAEPAKIKWTKTPGAIKYVVEVDDTKSFTSPSKFESKTDDYNFTPVNHLKYYYRIKALGKNKLSSAYSDVGELNITIKKPTLDKIAPVLYRSSKVDEPAPPMEFSLHWTHVPISKKYTIEYSSTSDFAEVSKVESVSNKAKVKVPTPGQYHFRVLASINSDQPFTPPSNVESSLYEFKQKLPSPILNEPRNKMTVFLQQEIEPFIWLNWEKDKIAQKYEFQVSTDPKFKKILISKEQDDNKFLIKEKLPLGKIYWRVRSLTDDPGLTSDWSNKREFILLHNKNNESFE